MEYERIHKVQSGVISPTKLRLKLIGKKEGSCCNSPSKIDDSEFINNTLLASPVQDFTHDPGQSKVPVAMESQSFEFRCATRSLSRPMSSKWNNAEKWIMSKQYLRPNILKKSDSQSPRKGPLSPELSAPDENASVKRVDFCQPAEETSVVPVIRSVSMRDMGTEMTPIPSQEPSRSVTPIGSTTPLRSPTSSIPSTPGRAEPVEMLKKEMSEEEMKLKTRREIVALGVQLGKMSIAAWASKEEDAGGEEIENMKRAAAWEEAETSKHAARFKREEIRIQAWESRQRVKLEDEMRKIEAEFEQMRGKAQAKMVRKVALARQKSEEKRREAEDRKGRRAEKTEAQAEYIRQTGRIPSSSPLHCCGWL